MRITTSKSEAMISGKRWGSPCLKWRSSNFWGVLFMTEGRMEHVTDRWIDAAAAVMLSMYQSIEGKELSPKVWLSIYQSIYVSALWSWLTGCIFDTSSQKLVTREELWVEVILIHTEMSQLRWVSCFLDTSLLYHIIWLWYVTDFQVAHFIVINR